MTSEITKHFQQADPILYEVAMRVGTPEPITPRPPQDYFRALCREIIAQQLSRVAARAVLDRFYDLFLQKEPSPSALATMPPETLRNVGMSWAKVRYVKNLAKQLESNEIELLQLPELTDEEAIAELVRVDGIGRWTAEMFLIFSLGREDVFSFGDRGLQRGIERIYGMPAFSRKMVEPIVEQWAPYRTWAARLVWKSLE